MIESNGRVYRNSCNHDLTHLSKITARLQASCYSVHWSQAVWSCKSSHHAQAAPCIDYHSRTCHTHVLERVPQMAVGRLECVFDLMSFYLRQEVGDPPLSLEQIPPEHLDFCARHMCAQCLSAEFQLTSESMVQKQCLSAMLRAQCLANASLTMLLWNCVIFWGRYWWFY